MTSSFLRCVFPLTLCLAASSALAQQPSPSDHADWLVKMQERAYQRSLTMKDFLCTQQVARFSAMTNPDKPDKSLKWKPLDRLTIAIDYSAGEHRNGRLVAVNGKSYELDKPRLGHSWIEPGTEFDILRVIFAPKAQTKFSWVGEQELDGRRLCIVRYDAPDATSGLTFLQGDKQTPLGHRGDLAADCSTGDIVRLRFSADPIPEEIAYSAHFGLKHFTEHTENSSQWEILYTPVKLEDGEHLLPTRSTVTANFGRELTRSESTFSAYRKFGASSHMLVVPTAEP